MKISNDKYYTPSDLAKRLIQTAFDELQKRGCEITDIIEPSAGSGSFSKQMDCTAYDILPESDDIIQADFLTEPIEYKTGRLCIGNPPFGHVNSLSMKFYQKCCKIGDYIAFIQPISQYNQNVQLYQFNLVYSENLGDVRFTDRCIPCCFNIYIRPATGGYNPKPTAYLEDVKFYESRRKHNNEPPSAPPQGWDYAMCVWGWGIVGKPSVYPNQFALEEYIYVQNKEYLESVLELVKFEKIDQFCRANRIKRLSQTRLAKYLKDNIKGLK